LSHLQYADWDRFDYTVLVPKTSEHVDAYRALGPVRILDLNTNDHLVLRRTRNPWYYAAYCPRFALQVAKIARYIRRTNVEIVHTQSSAYLGAAVAAKLTGRPSLVHVHEGGERVSSVLAGLYMRAARCSADIIIASAEYMAGYFKKPRDQSRLVVLYNGIDVNRFTPDGPPVDLQLRYGIPADHVVVGYVGRMHPRKDLLLLVDAFAQLLRYRKKATLLLVAAVDDAITAEYEKLVRQRVNDLGIEKDVVIDTGRVPDLPALYRSLAVTAYPAPVDYLPLAILESLASGVPVVNASEGGPRETVEDGVSGFQVRSGAPAALADGLLRMTSDETGLKAMGRAARELAVRRFNAQSFARNIENLYSSVLRGRYRPASSENSPATH
jgi:glycosyltransferase involved in cell wall biosynthesis